MFNIQPFFNNPEISNIVIFLNGKNYHLISDVLKHHSPFFSKCLGESTSVENILPMMSGDSDTRLLIKKRVVHLDKHNLDVESVINVLKYMYGFSLVITPHNAHNYLKIGTVFEMDQIIDQCYQCVENTISADNFVDNLDTAITENSLLLPIYMKKFLSTISSLDRERVLGFFSKLSPDLLHQIISNDNLICDENYKYDIVSNYCSANHKLESEIVERIMSTIDLSLISKSKLTNEVKNNPLIGIQKYCIAIESYLYPEKKIQKLLELKKRVIGIGRKGKKYDGFRPISINDIASDFLHIMKETYILFGGFLCLEDSCEEHAISLHGQTISLHDNKIVIHGNFIRPLVKEMKVGDIVRCYVTGHNLENNFDKITKGMFNPDTCDLVLLISK